MTKRSLQQIEKSLRSKLAEQSSQPRQDSASIVKEGLLSKLLTKRGPEGIEQLAKSKDISREAAKEEFKKEQLRLANLSAAQKQAEKEALGGQFGVPKKDIKIQEPKLSSELTAQQRAEQLLTGRGFKSEPAIASKPRLSPEPRTAQEKMIAQAEADAAAGKPTLAVTDPRVSKILDKLFPEKSPPQKIEPTLDEEKTLTEKYQQFLNDAKETPTYTKDQYIGWAKKYADQYKVPLPMVLHAMFKETGWLRDPEKMRIATSPTGARGVMQIQPEFAEKGAYKIKVKDLTDPEKNIEAGVRGLSYYFDKYKTPQKALAAYNAGEGGASKFLKTGDVNTLRTKETRNYIKGYKDDVVHQLEKFFPKDKQKVAKVATDVLATAVGAGTAQAADERPSSTGGPENKANQGKTSARSTNKSRAATPSNAVIEPWYKEWKQRNIELQKKGKPAIPLVQNEKGELVPKYLATPAAEPPKAAAEPPKVVVPTTVTPKQSGKPEGSSTTVTDTQGRSTTYTKNAKGQWVSPSGDVLPMPAKSVPKKDEPVRQSDAPPLGGQKIKKDSDLSRPAGGVSTAAVVPRSEPPKAAPTKITKVDPAYEPGTAEYDARMEKLQTAAGDKFSRERAARLKAAAEKPADSIELQRDQTGLKKAKRELSDFERAFAAARKEKGPGATFPYTDPRTGKTELKTTSYKDEKPPAKAADSADTSVTGQRKTVSTQYGPATLGTEADYQKWLDQQAKAAQVEPELEPEPDKKSIDVPIDSAGTRATRELFKPGEQPAIALPSKPEFIAKGRDLEAEKAREEIAKLIKNSGIYYPIKTQPTAAATSDNAAPAAAEIKKTLNDIDRDTAIERLVQQANEPTAPAEKNAEEMAQDELWKDIRAHAAGRSPEEISAAAKLAMQELEAKIAADQATDIGTKKSEYRIPTELSDIELKGSTEPYQEPIDIPVDPREQARRQAEKDVLGNELKEAINTQSNKDLLEILRLAGRK